MKRILILVSKKGVNKRFVDFLKRDLKGKGEVFYHTFQEIIVILNQNQLEIFIGRKKLSDFNLVYFRKTGSKYLSLAAISALYLDLNNIPYIDSIFKNLGPFGNKLYSLAKLALGGLPVIPTLFCSRDSMDRNIDYVEKSFGYPLISKDVVLQKLKGVYVIRNKEDVTELPRDHNFILQKFIGIKAEYRLLVLGDKVRVVHTKVQRSYENLRVDYLDQNAKEEYLKVDKIPEWYKKIAVESAKLLRLEIAGVDLVVDEDNRVWVIEVNRGPGLNQDPRISPELPEISKYLYNKSKTGQVT